MAFRLTPRFCFRTQRSAIGSNRIRVTRQPEGCAGNGTRVGAGVLDAKRKD